MGIFILNEWVVSVKAKSTQNQLIKISIIILVTVLSQIANLVQTGSHISFPLSRHFVSNQHTNEAFLSSVVNLKTQIFAMTMTGRGIIQEMTENESS